MITHLLERLYELTKEHDIDIALTTKGPDAYAAAMHCRKNLEGSLQNVWPEDLKEDSVKGKVERLSQHCLADSLVLFLGAGVSAGAGLPGWKELMQRLASRTGILKCGNNENQGLCPAFKGDPRPCDPESLFCVTLDHFDECKVFASLDPMDQARLIADELAKKEGSGQSHSIGAEVAELLQNYQYFSLSHAILAATPIKEVVTTNYDSLFEKASGSSQDRTVPVIPYDPPVPGKQWLLKLHGCVEKPEDIVLTRSDYLRYHEQRAALKGIVQALLITRHMLFVGFSLTDQNFFAIIDDVRKAVRRNGDKRKIAPFGTALSPNGNHFIERLWEGDLNWITFKGHTAESYRMQEIFLDYLASRSISSTAHLMDERFDGVLTKGEKDLRCALSAMIESVSPEAKETAAWREVRNLLERLGTIAG